LIGKSVGLDAKGKVALVTGINGFTGRFIQPFLEQRGYEVFGTAHGAETASGRVCRVDLTDSAQTSQFLKELNPDVVIHLAAISLVSHKNIEQIYAVNVLGTRNLLSALADLAKPPSSVVIASSANVYGNSQESPLSETMQPKPENDYAVSKVAVENLAHVWRDHFPITVTRPFNYTGIGQSTDFLIPKIVEHFKQKQPSISLGNIDVWRDFSDVRYVAGAYMGLVENPTRGQVFNICSGVATSLRDIIDYLIQKTGHNIEIQTDPSLVRSNEVLRLKGDPDKLKNHLGQLPENDIWRTLDWMLEN
jgi:nucleoside-diphosphate-sugar epimerase